MFTAARTVASKTNAVRHPNEPTSAAIVGTNTVLANPPTDVSTVSANAGRRANQARTRANAGSYSTAAIVSPRPNQMM